MRRAVLQKELPGWHYTEAAECEKAGQWFAVAFHLAQLLKHDPQDKADVQRRLEAARGKLK